MITANTGRSVGAAASSTAQTKRSARASVYARAAEKERESRTSQGSGALLETLSAAQSGRRAALSAGFGLSVAALFPSTALALLPDDDAYHHIELAASFCIASAFAVSTLTILSAYTFPVCLCRTLCTCP